MQPRMVLMVNKCNLVEPMVLGSSLCSYFLLTLYVNNLVFFQYFEIVLAAAIQSADMETC